MTEQRFHIISGLPRSGSTLLSSILKQNPNFHAGVTSPVLSLVASAMPHMSGKSEFATFFSDRRRRDVLRALFGAYYAEQSEGVIFDTNRMWTGRLPLMAELFPEARCICLVRDIPSVLGSFERILSRNPLQIPSGMNFKGTQTVYSRAEALMNSGSGLIGLAWSALREAWFGEQASRLIVITYDRLVADPGHILTALYRELELPPFTHDFQRVAFDQEEYDASLGMPGLHTVRPQVTADRRPPAIPPDLVAKYAEASFWAKPNLNPRGVTIL